MRKMFLSTLVVFGFMNFCFGQLNVKSERITVQTYDDKGLIKQLRLKGQEALAFDIPSYILENEDNRVVIKGRLQTKLSTTIIEFDSQNQENVDSDHICKEVSTQSIPFLGIWGFKKKNDEGVDIKEVISTTSADRAGLTNDEDIVGFNGEQINNFKDLLGAVASTQVGERVILTLSKGSNEYSKHVTMGSRDNTLVSYKYCQEESTDANDLTTLEKGISLTSFPNPTGSISHVNFSSDSKEDVIFSVMDIRGNLIHKENFSNFSGNLKLDYNHKNSMDGTYILSIQQGKELYKRQVQLIK